jgi:hypothetical protein
MPDREVSMIDLNMLHLLHPHGDRDVPMRPRPHDPAETDPEREWSKHGRVYECECGETVTVLPAHPEGTRPFAP